MPVTSYGWCKAAWTRFLRNLRMGLTLFALDDDAQRLVCERPLRLLVSQGFDVNGGRRLQQTGLYRRTTLD